MAKTIRMTSDLMCDRARQFRTEAVVREIEAVLDITARRYEVVDASVAGQFRG